MSQRSPSVKGQQGSAILPAIVETEQPRPFTSQQILRGGGDHQPLPPKSFRKGPWVVGGLAIYSFTAYGAYLYLSLNRATNDGKTLDIPEDVSDRYNKIASRFDKDVNFTEKFMGLGWLRQSLTRRAWGNVLEVSVGTARNAQYYKVKNCKSITMVDRSPEMIEIARKTFRVAHPEYKSYRFVNQSAHDPIICPAASGFNTIIETMGLCSTPQPSLLLARLGAVTDPANGQILLLEHGRSHYAWLNRILDKTAPAHADRHGCWWNRDIGKIVEESGLEIVKIRRYHLGTTWWVELKPRKI